MTLQSVFILFGILLLSCMARWARRTELRQWLLLGASYVVYVQLAGAPYLLILVASSVLNYSLGALLRRRPRAIFLWIGIVLNASLLGFFKYLPTIAEADILRRIILPLGISFWTFQGLSYLFDVYLEKEADPSLVEFCLYIAFWPTVTSGPVCRLPQMLPQFRRLTTSFRDDFSIGVVRLTQGLFMKFVLAELLGSGLSLGGGVNAGFDAIATQRSALDVWALAIGYAFQLFFDFAGYSHMVIGVSRLMGFQLQENFNSPYLAASPSIFWTRWHMSLSSWIREYVFLPLATLGRSAWWPHMAMLISMVIFGFWHGGKLTYICWGVYHGSLLIGHRYGQKLKRRIRFTLPSILGATLSRVTTFLLITVGYIFFRSNDIRQSLSMLRSIFTPRSYAADQMTLPRELYLLVILMAGGYFVYAGLAQLLLRLWPTSTEGWDSSTVYVAGALADRRWWLLAPLLILLSAVTGLVFFGQSSNIAPFIYAIF